MNDSTDQRSGKKSYPLCWPDGWPRTQPNYRQRSRFKGVTLAGSLDYVISEINRLNNRGWNHTDDNVIVSTNIKPTINARLQGSAPSDPGAAIYFVFRYSRQSRWLEMPVVLACDKWRTVEENLCAIGHHIDALRGQERWGVGRIEQAFRGYTAIPEKTGGLSWWEILEIPLNASAETIQASYHRLAKVYHPDNGTEPNHEKMVILNDAYKFAMPQKVS